MYLVSGSAGFIGFPIYVYHVFSYSGERMTYFLNIVLKYEFVVRVPANMFRVHKLCALPMPVRSMPCCGHPDYSLVLFHQDISSFCSAYGRWQLWTRRVNTTKRRKSRNAHASSVLKKLLLFLHQA